MIKLINRISTSVISHYFLLTSINACLIMLGLVSFAKLDLLIMLCAIVITINYLSHNVYFIDLFVLAFIFIIAISGFVQDYPYEFWYDGCRTQLFNILFFFVGRYPQMSNMDVLKKGLYPFLIVCIIGLILYIYQPSWYLDYKLHFWSSDTSVNRILEMSRFSAFWTYPYWISYGSAIMYSFLLYQSYIEGEIKLKNGCLLIFIFFISILTQQRAPLTFILATTLFYFSISTLTLNKIKSRSLWKTMSLLIIVIFCAIFFSISFMSSDMAEKLFEKINALSDASSFLKERSGIFDYFKHKTISFLGDGIGKYSHEAVKMGKYAITDQQYLQIIHESGYLGCFGYSFIIISIIIKGIKNLKQNLLYLIIISFFLMAMTGANCLSNFDQHTAIFWLCCGYIYNKKK